MAASKSINRLSNDAAELLQKIVRLKAADENGYCKCWSCGTVDHWKNMQGGHYIQRGKIYTRLVEENIHPQCRACNGFGMKFGSAAQQYTLAMVDYYGREFVDELIASKDKIRKHTRTELEDLIKELKSQVKELETIN